MHAAKKYSERAWRIDGDGDRTFRTVEDDEREAEVAEGIERTLGPGLSLRKTASKFDVCDFDAYRDGKPCAVVEVKCRSHSTGSFRTVWLNLRKYRGLRRRAKSKGVAAFFVVRFTDQTMCISLDEVDVTRINMHGGTRHRVKSSTDQEPVIEIPISSMLMLYEHDSFARRVSSN